METIIKACKNKVLHFVFIGYATYLIQFINSLFIATYLGPYFLGIWGFINLVLQYINQINFGISHSINAIVSVNKQKEWYNTKIVGTAISMLIVLSILVALFFVINNMFNLQLGEKYNFSQFTPFVFLIAILGYFNGLLSNIYRIYGKLFEIAFFQSSFPFLLLIVILFFKGKNLLWAIIIANSIAVTFSFILFAVKSPIRLHPLFNIRLAKKIQQKGWHLFIYNTSFYLIIISTRSFISAYYDVSEFGYFTFAFTLANAILLLLESLSFLVYPKMLNRFASGSLQNVSYLLGIIRDAYITTSHALIHLAVLLFPIFLIAFPKYQAASSAFKLIALTIVLYTNSFGYSGLMIAKNKEKHLGFIALISLCINIIIALLLVKIFKVAYTFVFVSTMITYAIYVFSLGFWGRKILQLKRDFISILKDVFPVRLFLPYIVSFILVAIHAEDSYFLIPFILFILINVRNFSYLKDVANTIITNPEFIKL